MTVKQKIRAVLLLLILCFGIGVVASWPHWLTPHGKATCGGQALPGALVYRSQRGDIFVLGVDIQPAVISPESRQLGRCNSPAFTRVFGLLFSREAEPTVQCTAMWKGLGSREAEPPHIVTDTYAEFPWGSCPKLRIDY